MRPWRVGIALRRRSELWKVRVIPAALNLAGGCRWLCRAAQRLLLRGIGVESPTVLIVYTADPGSIPNRRHFGQLTKTQPMWAHVHMGSFVQINEYESMSVSASGLLTTAEVATALRKSTQTIRRWVKQKRIRAVPGMPDRFPGDVLSGLLPPPEAPTDDVAARLAKVMKALNTR